jgi:hypothetical protein
MNYMSRKSFVEYTTKRFGNAVTLNTTPYRDGYKREGIYPPPDGRFLSG